MLAKAFPPGIWLRSAKLFMCVLMIVDAAEATIPKRSVHVGVPGYQPTFGRFVPNDGSGRAKGVEHRVWILKQPRVAQIECGNRLADRAVRVETIGHGNQRSSIARMSDSRLMRMFAQRSHVWSGVNC